MDLLQDENEDVVHEAIRGLVRHDAKQANRALLDVGTGPDPVLATEAGRALRRLGDESATAAAADNVAQGLSSESASDRRETVKRLTRIGGPAVVHHLEWALQDPVVRVSRQAIRGLAAVTNELERSR